MPLYIAPDKSRTVIRDIKVQAAELSNADGETVNVVNICAGEHNLALMREEVLSLVSALQSMCNQVTKSNLAKAKAKAEADAFAPVGES